MSDIETPFDNKHLDNRRWCPCNQIVVTVNVWVFRFPSCALGLFC